MKPMMRVAAVAAMGAALSACGGDWVTGGPLIRPGEPTGQIEVVNATGMAMNVVLISACSASTYGLNRLPSGTAIPSGGSYRFTVSAGCWDVGGGVTGVGDAYQRLTVGAGRVASLTIH